MHSLNLFLSRITAGLIFMITTPIMAQLGANYTLEKSVGVYSSISTTGTAVPILGDDLGANITNLSPGFTVNGITYTKVRMSSNGWIALYSVTAPTATTAYAPLSTAMTNGSVIIAAFGGDQNGTGATAWRQTIGNEHIFEWKNFYRFQATGESLNYQIRLNTVTNDITVIYGDMIAGTGTNTPQVGFKTTGTTAANWATDVNNLTINVTGSPNTCTWAEAVTGNANNSTMYLNSVNPLVKPSPGLTFTWTPQTAPAPVRTFSAISSITSSSATVSWIAPVGATAYELQYRLVGQCDWVDFSGNPLSSATATITGLMDASTYQVRVRAKNGINSSIWSHIPNSAGGAGTNGNTATGTFTTIALPPTVTGLSPNQPLCSTGGQQVIIYGSSFIAGSIVRFNGVNATGIVINSATQITCVTPIGVTAGNITVQTNAGTSAIDTANAYTLVDGPALSFSTGANISPCGNYPTLVEVTNTNDNSNSTTFSWSPFNDGISADTGTVVLVETAINQTYTVTATDSLGCTASANLVVTPTAPAAVTLTPSIPFFCGEGGTTTIAISSDNANYEYTVEALDGGVISNISSSGFDFTLTQTGTARVVAIDTSAQCSSEAFASIGVYDYMQPTLTATPSTIFEGPVYDLQSDVGIQNFSVQQITHEPLSMNAPSITTLVSGGVLSVPLTSGNIDDGGWGNIPLGFSFNFEGTTFTSCNISTNGLLLFGDYNAQWMSDFNYMSLPSPIEPTGLIAVLAMDHNPVGVDGGSIRYRTDGVAPNRRFIVSYENVKEFGDTKYSTAHAIIYEGSNYVEVHVTGSTNIDANKTVGINSPDGNVGTIAFSSGTTATDTNPILTPFAYRFRLSSNYVTTWSPDSLISGTAQGVNLFNRTTEPLTEPGTYTFSLVATNSGNGCSNSDNPATVSITIEAPFDQSYLTGYAYFDTECNGIYDGDDIHVAYPMLLQGDTVPVGSSNGIGSFYLVLNDNTTTTLTLADIPFWENDTILTLITTDTAQSFENVAIGLCPSLNSNDLCVSMNSNGNPRPGFIRRYNIIASNLWPGSDSAIVQFNYAQMPGASIASYSPGGIASGGTISFTTNLTYGQPQLYYVDVLVAANVPLGTMYQPHATIALLDTLETDYAPENNAYTLYQTIIGSYDPNDKLVTPAVVDLLDLDATGTELLEYTIRFQNTGTAEAIFVRVLDTLSQALNPATFQHITTSHPAEIIFHDNHVVEWFFDNIMLPDSFSNEQGSHGFIQFRIRTNELSAPFDLENSASIYFDFNAPVITPPAVTAIVICAEAGSACDDVDPCTVDDMIHADCSCAGTFADSDNDGVCDSEDGCDAALFGTVCDDLDPCTLNDLIQSDCSCAGQFTDTDGDGICDAEDACGEAPVIISADTDLTIACGEEVPDFMVTFSMTDGSSVSIAYRDSVLSQTGCHPDILQIAIGTNTCGDSTIVSRTVTIEDLIPPTFADCVAEVTLNCTSNVNSPPVPEVSDNCSSSIVVSYTENCLDCTTDSTVYPCATPVRPADNPCGYPYDWSLALFNLPSAHRWYQVDTTVPATMTDYHDGTVTFRGRWVNVLDTSGGFDYEFTLEDGLNWTDWNNLAVPNGFLADCGGLDENHQDWMYYLLQSGAGFELQGWGSYAGSLMNITHAPSNQYYAHQIGLGANNYSAQYGMGGWALTSGFVLVNGSPITSGNGDGSCDIRFAMPSCTGHTSEVTWTASDCSGNTTTCSQIIHFEPTFDQPECFVDNPCNDNDPCTIGDTYQADCSCVGSLLDNDNDGLCDLTAPCDGVIIGEPCNDLDTCTINDLIQPDCSCAGTFADNDSDGICDAEDACDNTLAGAACDDEDPCTTNDLIQSDCSCTGTFADTDNDGICDASEIAGCMDIQACNYNALATDDDGSCVYVESLTIAGNLTAMAGVSESYSYPGPASSSYQWSITPGTIQSGQGTTTVSVIWDDAPFGTLQVTETNEAECLGSAVVLEVNITPNNVTSWNNQSMVLYPNPASDILHLSGNISSNAQVSIYNGIGQCVYTGTLASTINVRSLPTGVYHLHIGEQGNFEHFKFSIAR